MTLPKAKADIIFYISTHVEKRFENNTSHDADAVGPVLYKRQTMKRDGEQEDFKATLRLELIQASHRLN